MEPEQNDEPEEPEVKVKAPIWFEFTVNGMRVEVTIEDIPPEERGKAK